MPAIQLDQRPQELPEVVEARSAFLVFITDDGLYGVSSDINIPITTKRPATQPEIKAALSVTLDTMNNQEVAIQAAQQVMNMQMQVAQAVKNAQDSQAVLGKLDLRK